MPPAALLLRRGALAAPILLASLPAPAQFMDTAVLWDMCRQEDGSYSTGFCEGYVAGLSDLIISFQLLSDRREICLPETGFDRAKEVVRDTLEAASHGASQNAALLIGKALAETFPCPPDGAAIGPEWSPPPADSLPDAGTGGGD